MNPQIMEDNVSREISPNDEMYAKDKDYGDWYWHVGASAIESISRCLGVAGKRNEDMKQILDLPCGHGRVLRHIRAAFPHAEITACDILRDGVDFCASAFGAKPVYSHEDPKRIALEPGKFDLIWVGSLFTHFNARLWREFLDFFASRLSPGGMLVFSAHGRYIYNRIRGIEDPLDYGLPYWRNTLICSSYDRTGFGYSDYLQANGYGISISDPSWVTMRIEQTPELRLISFAQQSWHRVHDIYGCVRVPNIQRQTSTIPATLQFKHAIRQILPQPLVEYGKTLLHRHQSPSKTSSSR